MKKLKLSHIRTDGGTQPREQVSEDVATEYAEAMNGGAEFPPVDVFYDGEAYWLADGFHRVLAATVTKQKTITADIHQGTRRDAVLFAAGANASHGLRRTNDDKRRAVLTLLQDEEWAKWSASEIAKQTKTSATFVAKMKSDPSINVYRCDNALTTNVYSEPSEKQPSGEPRTARRGGKTYTINTTNIGRRGKAARLATGQRNGRTPTTKPSPAKEPLLTVLGDGTKVAVKTQKEVQAYQDTNFQAVNAIEGLADMPVTPAQYCQNLPPHFHHIINKDLAAAVQWLTTFAQNWRQHEKRA